MNKIYILKEAKDKKHKYIVTTPEGKMIKFGAYGYKDYIFYSKHNHPDKFKKKINYISRHGPYEDFNNLNTAGCWSRYILWNQSTLDSSITSMQNKFNIKISH